MGFGSCLWFDFSFSLEFRLLLALLTLYPHPTFAPLSGESSVLLLTLCPIKVPWIRCVHLWVHHICKICYTGTLWPTKDPHTV